MTHPPAQPEPAHPTTPHAAPAGAQPTPIDATPAPPVYAGAAPAQPAANPWRGLTSFWVTYPVGFGLLGIALSLLLLFGSESDSALQAVLAGAGFMVLGLAIYAEILVGLLFLVRKVNFEGLGKLVWLVGTALFAGAAYVGCLIMGTDPWLLTIVAVFVGMFAVGIGQAIARSVLYGRRVPTLVCLAICVIFVVISLAMLPMSLGA